MSEVASSSTATSSTSSLTDLKHPKRRLNAISDYDFFAPAASSFQPRPYTPHANSSDRTRPLQFTRSQGRPHDSLAIPAGADPHPSDPNVIFIHPPFTTFPNSNNYTEGLSYQVLAENSEWFLDPKDFIHENNNNTHAVPYPPILEPPRGWCPAKKRDLKERGSDGWPEGEEPRLRCTFCRRTYAGINAKSMWRRHVFEKHKIAMANRRDGQDRPRGRSSNKENKQVVSRSRDDGHDTLVNLKLDVAPGTDPQNISHKSKFRSTGARIGLSVERKTHTSETSTDIAALPPESDDINTTDTRHHSSGPGTSPPLTPRTSSDAGNTSVESPRVPPTPPSTVPLIPPSPYDPYLTPAFRHSPRPLPSDQPWRFPSPSHPLHSQSREISLSMLVRNLGSPLVKGSPILGGSPLVYGPSPSRRPRPETPLNEFKLPLNHTRLRIAGSPLPTRADPNRPRHRIEESPLSRVLTREHKRSFSELTDDWFSEASMLSSQLSDPFNSLFPPGETRERSTPIKRILEAESPVLRNRSETKGLGIGLLEPFDLNVTRNSKSDDEVDINDILDSSSNFGDGQELDTDGDQLNEVLRGSPLSPPCKKRKLNPYLVN